MTDCILLAAGRGSRLRGVIPQFHKPLLVVDGQALIVSIIKQARAAGADRIIVVLAPENAQPVTSLLIDANVVDGKTFFVIQPEATGPGHALLLGAELARSDRVLVLMGDNVFGPGDIESVMKHAGDVIVGVACMQDMDRARRFTRVNPHGTYEGIDIDESQRHIDHDFYVWLGPLLVRREKLCDELRGAAEHTIGELKIGPWLGNVGGITTVQCATHDVGDVNGWVAEHG